MVRIGTGHFFQACGIGMGKGLHFLLGGSFCRDSQRLYDGPERAVTLLDHKHGEAGCAAPLRQGERPGRESGFFPSFALMVPTLQTK